jgi:hypothetical protein
MALPGRQAFIACLLCKPVKLLLVVPLNADLKCLSTNYVKNEAHWRRKTTRNSKGCDIGYALAVSSCEGANSVEACTVTALDAITAFAVPNPNCSSQSQSVFSGLVANQVALVSRSLSLLRTGKVLIKPTLSAVDVSHVKQLLH